MVLGNSPPSSLVWQKSKDHTFYEIFSAPFPNAMQTWNLLLVLTRRQRFGSRFRKQQNILELPSVTMQGGELLTSATSKLTSTTSQQTIWLHSQARTEAIVRWIPNHDCTLACLPGQIQMQIQIQIKIQIHLHTQSRKKQALPRPAEKEKCLISFFLIIHKFCLWWEKRRTSFSFGFVFSLFADWL